MLLFRKAVLLNWFLLCINYSQYFEIKMSWLRSCRREQLHRYKVPFEMTSCFLIQLEMFAFEWQFTCTFTPWVLISYYLRMDDLLIHSKRRARTIPHLFSSAQQHIKQRTQSTVSVLLKCLIEIVLNCYSVVWLAWFCLYCCSSFFVSWSLKSSVSSSFTESYFTVFSKARLLVCHL